MGKSDFEFCSKQHNKSGRFIEACLLVLLEEEDSYGYSLMEKLETFNFSDDSLNMSIIYRNLKSMETRNLIESYWIKGDMGPDKKVYKLTNQGKEEAEKWIELLRFRKTQLQLIIEKYEEISKEGI